MNAKKINENNVDLAQKTIAIIQVTRIGDILQTIHAARLLKINHPSFRLILIARKQFVEPIKFITDQVFDKVHSVDFKSSVNLADGVKGSSSNIKNILKNINSEVISASVNLSFSKSSCYLHSLINSKHKLGPYFSENHDQIIQDKWSQYLFSSVMRGDMNPFNLVDLFAGILGVEKEKTHLTNIEYSNPKKDKLLLHPFASLERKKWTESKWTEVLFKVLNNNKDLKVFVAGSNHDKEAYNKIVNNPILEKVKERIIPLLGRPVSELYEMVDETYLFVGHDSMVGNLLSFKNIKSVTMSLGSVRPQETAPYAINNYVLSPKSKCFPCFPDTKCDFFQCHADIPYQTVINVIEQLLISNSLNKDQLTERVSAFNLNSVTISKTTADKAGYLVLEDIYKENSTAKEIFRDFYKIIWAYTFSETDINLKSPSLSKETFSHLKETSQIVEHLYELSEFGKKYARYILEEISKKSPNLDNIKGFSAKIDEIDRLLSIVRETNPLLAPVVDYCQVAKSNMQGTNIVQLTESAFYIYQEVSTTTSIIYDFLSTIGAIKEKEPTTSTRRKNI